MTWGSPRASLYVKCVGYSREVKLHVFLPFVVNHQFSIGKGLRAYGIVFVEMLYFDSAVPLMLLHGIRYMRCVRFAVYAVMSSFICLCFACTLFCML